MHVSDNVRVVPVPSESPMHTGLTNIYLVGTGQVLAIDSGEALDSYKWMLRGYLSAIEQAEIALTAITHHHFDHSGNLKWVNELLHSNVMVHERGVPLLKDKLPEEKYVRIMRNDEVIDLGNGVRPRVLFTPGHSVDSVCYYVEDDGVLFTGDTLLGNSTTTVHELGPYRQSLKMLSELPNLKVICPGHGNIVHDPRERLIDLIKHREMRDRQILGVLEGSGPQSAWDIMMKVYPENLDKRLRRPAARNVQTHLDQLMDEGRLLEVPGKRRKADPEKAKRERAKAREQDKLVRQAKKIEKDRAQAAIRAQELPPTAEWSRPPRYELVGRAKD
jgi:glyoxylase-like metal-dependent hydrolase (beta-lactamase superfamily II)